MIAFARAPATLPDGERVYAVGDVHGCLERLRAMHGAIAEDIARRPAASVTLVHIGDYVDRGPDSAGVLDRLAAAPPPPGVGTVVNLLGNHEAMMLDAVTLRTPAAARLWLANGGEATLRSFGLGDTDDPAAWAACLPADRVGFLRALAVTHRAGGYVFVHAGLRPGLLIAQQAREDLLWIREPFLSTDTAFEAVVVHGHTPVPAPVLRPNRIGIDTGAVMGGALTGVVLEADRVGFISA
ncbi:MAG: metallophosphoesterase family protein [Acetobacteraceae bacterium]